ncbi:hypothetical protein [Lysinibacillus fusiformis]|uniref:hypothetical protein n=1 Tax=Lysinibacillus fusiformis TaxID=28031 RepID=UPI003CFE26EF
MSMRLRMAPEDRETYGGPEWLDDDASTEALSDLDLDTLMEIEAGVKAELSMTLNRLTGTSFVNWEIPHLRGRLWLALRAAGVEVDLDDFKPAKILRTVLEVPKRGGDDADPPASEADSGTASTSTTPTPPSETSDSASTPGSPDTTE